MSPANPTPERDETTLTEYWHWCRARNCDHAHCPNECDHPQPFVIADGRLVCGRCAIIGHELVDMVACTPETCQEGGRP